MASAKLVLECPYCYWVIEATPPDRVHSAYSFEKPLMGSFNGKVIEQNFVCRNPNCKKQITIYWYSPRDYFNRI